jgi:P27 family predicted phage terminase small subunit
MRGRIPEPTAIRRMKGNPGKRAWNHAEPIPPEGMPDCPGHLSEVAREEWYRLAESLYRMGVLTMADRAVMAGYCQTYSRWVEAEEKLKTTPAMLKTPSGYVQQSPWIGVANKQLELMGRYMSELGLTPASRSRIAIEATPAVRPITIERIILRPLEGPGERVAGSPQHEDGTLILSGPDADL